MTLIPHKLVLALLILLCITNALLAQTSHWETIFHNDGEFRYLTSQDAPPADSWRENSFDDAGWHSGIGGIGYGDGDDGTVIEGISWVFLRKTFDISDKAEIHELALSIDYDDAFVAYLNGSEIARSAGLDAPFPAAGTFSSAQHDANIPDGGKPDTYFISSDQLQNGTNVLAVQVHNATATSSDLSSSVWLSAGLSEGVSRFSDTPDWFSVPGQVTVAFESNLPILIIDTNGQNIPDDPKVTAYMGLIYNGPGEINSSEGDFNEYAGYIGIERRGNSTQNFPKTPYKFETRDENGENRNVSLLGMPAENDWILRASYLDHTFIRNSLASHLSQVTGNWASRVRHVEVIIDDEYQGIYLLMEEIKRDKNRLDLATLLPEDLEGEELTGGYVWKVDGFGSQFGSNRTMVEPRADELLPVQQNYIRNVDDAFRALMSGSQSAYSNPNTGYVQHINVESFIRELIVQETMRNSDSYAWSAYFYKDKNELIKAGPAWDFDQSAGNSSYPDNGEHIGWLIQHPGKGDVPDFWRKLLDDPYFRYSLKLRWEELRAGEYSNASIVNYIDSIASELSSAQQREFGKWPVLGANFWRETNGYEQRDTYQKEVDYLKEFIALRLAWIDEQLNPITKPAGYPVISSQPLDNISVNLAEQQIVIELSEIFTYPYSSPLRYEAFSGSGVVALDIDGDVLKVDLLSAGTAEIQINCIDTYGNRKSESTQIEIAPLDAVGTEFESTLPIVIIQTSDTIRNSPKVTAHMGIVWDEDGQKNLSTGSFTAYNGSIGIDIRGGESKDFPKYSYNIETRTATGENNNVSLFGMPAENDWILSASYLDHSFIRNCLASNLARKAGQWASDSRHVELIVDGEYKGIYLLQEKIKRDANRLDIARLNPDEISGEDLTGGYLWEVDPSEDEFGQNRSMSDPDWSDMAIEQQSYIQQVDDAFRASVSYPDFSDPNTGYVQHINVESFIDELIVQEVMGNVQAYEQNAFFHKDKNDPIKAGPVWDFDQSAGNSGIISNSLNAWLVSHDNKSGVPSFWSKLFEDTFFKYSLRLRWEELRNGGFSDASISQYIDSISASLSIPQTREFSQWPVLGQNIYQESAGFENRKTYSSELDHLKDFVEQRCAWIDEQLASVAKPLGYPEFAGEFKDLKILIGSNRSINLDEVFDYPYASGLSYEFLSSDTTAISLDLDDGHLLEIEANSIGSSDVGVIALDTYGNRATLEFNVAVVNTDELGTVSTVHLAANWPNPSAAVFEITAKQKIEKLVIHDVSGSLVLTEVNINSTKYKIDLKAQKSGIYILSLTVQSGLVLQQKLVKD